MSLSKPFLTSNNPKTLFLGRHGESLANTSDMTLKEINISETKLLELKILEPNSPQIAFLENQLSKLLIYLTFTDDDHCALSSKGLNQALSLRDRVVEMGIVPKCIFSSPYLRAQQTAMPLAKLYDLDIEIIDSNRELWQATQLELTPEQLLLSLPQQIILRNTHFRKLDNLFWENPDIDFVCGRESFRQMVQRARYMIQEYIKVPHHSFFFGHGNFGHLILWCILNQNNELVIFDKKLFKEFTREFKWENAELVEIIVDGDTVSVGKRIKNQN